MIPDWVANIIKAWILSKQTGYIQINFFKGGITSVNKFDTVKE